MTKMFSLLLLIGLASANPVLYNIDAEDNEVAQPILTPVSSTVIPLEDLPELQVGYGFGLIDRNQKPKPSHIKDIKLITANNKHRFVAPAGVKQLSKEEFERFSSS